MKYSALVRRIPQGSGNTMKCKVERMGELEDGEGAL